MHVSENVLDHACESFGNEVGGRFLRSGVSFCGEPRVPGWREGGQFGRGRFLVVVGRQIDVEPQRVGPSEHCGSFVGLVQEREALGGAFKQAPRDVDDSTQSCGVCDKDPARGARG